MRRLLKFIWPYKGLAALALTMGFLVVASNIGLMSTSGYLIASAALHPSTILLLWVPIVGVRFFGLSRGAFRYLERIFAHDLTFRILALIRVKVFSSLTTWPLRRWQTERSGDWLSVVMSDVDVLQDFYLRVLAPTATAVLSGVLGCVILGSLNWKLALSLAIMFTMAGFGIPWLARILGKASTASMGLVKQRFYRRLIDTLWGMRDVLLHNRAEATIHELENHQHAWTTLQSRMSHITGLVDGMMVVASAITVWTLFWISIPMVSHRQLTGVELVVVVLTTMATFEAIAPLPMAFQYWERLRTSTDRVFGLTSEEPVTSGREDTVVCLARGATLGVDRVTVHNGTANPPALKEVSFTLPWGKRVAIVGSSGSGKTTLLQSILGLVPISDGSIQLGGTDIGNLSDGEKKVWFTVVPQTPYLFHATVAQNLRMAEPSVSDDELMAALTTAQIAERVVALPQGLNTVIGEFGERVSGGERQRISLARALLRKQAILVMDEPTTGLDALTEQGFMTALFAASQGRSLILATHRLIGLDRFDEILVMQRGTIVERGSHAELVARRGIYRHMLEVEADMLTGRWA